MRLNWQTMALLVTMSMASACGGRVSHPVVRDQPLDARLSCAHHAGEYENNNKRLEELTGERSEKFSNNLGLLIASPLHLDFSDVQRKEATAIVARNERLIELMKEKGCDLPVSSAVPQASDQQE